MQIMKALRPRGVNIMERRGNVGNTSKVEKQGLA